MKITQIEVLPLRVPYEDRIRKIYYHFEMKEEVTVYRFHTDTGLVGLGENGGAPLPKAALDAYIGTNPFDHVMGKGLFHLDMACYDLMGKHLGLPAWKLMGQQARQWVSMGWWMPSMSPEGSAAEVEVAAARGYRGLKCKARAVF
ncbi:MAG: mandelate racemase/muconate lactonizing enzyme family protein, partial [bacterium]|nr:mandelate racemase/muconate lactonizing enzyme family protein [bacterium]